MFGEIVHAHEGGLSLARDLLNEKALECRREDNVTGVVKKGVYLLVTLIEMNRFLVC